MGRSYTTKETIKRDKFFLPIIKEIYVVKKNGKIYNRKTKKRVGIPTTISSYGGIGIRLNGKVHFFNVHRVVWLVHKGFIPIGYTINHKNGIKSISRLSNLECITSSENQKHAFKLGLNVNNPQIGSTNVNAKFTAVQVRKIRNLFIGKKFSRRNFKIIANKYGVHWVTIQGVVTRKRYKDVA